MHARRLGRYGFVLVLGLGLSTVAAQEKKRAVPPAAAQAKVGRLIQELYQDELAKAAKDPAAKLRLAQTLLQEGKDTGDDAAGRYVLFKEAHQLAAEAGDVATPLYAAHALPRDFPIPAPA